MPAPRWQYDYPLLAMVARHLHTARTIQARGAFEAGRITRAQANDAVRITRSIARSWSRIADVGTAPADLWNGDRGGAWDHERVRTLQAFAGAARVNAHDAGGDFELLGLADAIDTLVGWETDSEAARALLAAGVPVDSLTTLPVHLPAVAAGDLTIPDAPARVPIQHLGEAA